MAESRARRSYLVDGRFQLKYALLLAGWGLVVTLLGLLLGWQAERQALELLGPDPAHAAALALVERRLGLALAAVGLFTVGTLGLLGFLVSHRVAGPARVLTLAFAELAEGRLPARRGLRRSDELRALHERFHEAVEALGARDRRTLAALEEAVGLLQPLADDPRVAPALAALTSEARARREVFAPPAGTPV